VWIETGAQRQRIWATRGGRCLSWFAVSALPWVLPNSKLWDMKLKIPHAIAQIERLGGQNRTDPSDCDESKAITEKKLWSCPM